MAASFSYKITSENEQFTFDYSTVMATGETISTATCVVTVQNGTDSSPSSILVGTPVVSGQLAAQRIYNGLDGVIYRIAMTVTSSLSNTYTIVADLPVLSSANSQENLLSYTSRYDSGDWIADCDVCGRKYKASALSERWDGLMCCDDDWEIRQPQDFVRGVPDTQIAPWLRPEPPDQFIVINFTPPAVVIPALTTATLTAVPIWAPWNPRVTSTVIATLDIAKRTEITPTSINGSPLNTQPLG